MTTPVPLPLFTAQQFVEAFVTHDSLVSGGDPTIQPVSALARFTPVDVRGKTLTEVVVPGSNPPMTVRLRPITGRLDTDGHLRTMNGEPVYYQDGVTRNPPPAGTRPVMGDDGRTPAYWIDPQGVHYANPSGTPVFGLRLIANSDALGVPGGLMYYRVTYSGTNYDAIKDLGVNEFVFPAATTDVIVDLGSVPRVNEFNTSAVPAVVDNVSAAITAWRAELSTFDLRISGAYVKPDSGIPKADMTSAVQTSLGKADSAYQAPAVVAAGSTPAAARSAIGALHGIIVDSAGTASTTKQVRITYDEFGNVDDIITEEA